MADEADQSLCFSRARMPAIVAPGRHHVPELPGVLQAVDRASCRPQEPPAPRVSGHIPGQPHEDAAAGERVDDDEPVGRAAPSVPVTVSM